jgi:hypothetical protein
MIGENILKNFRNIDSLQIIIDSYNNCIKYQKGCLDKKQYIEIIINFYKKYLNISINICGGCSTALNSEHTRFQFLLLTILYKIYPNNIHDIDEKIFDYKYFTQKRELLLTSSFDSFINIYNKFENDYINKHTGIASREAFEYVKKILLDFNTRRQNILLNSEIKIIENKKIETPKYSDMDIYNMFVLDPNIENIAKHFKITKRAVGSILKKYK